MEDRRWHDAGGTPGGFGHFVIGLAMASIGGYLLTNQVIVAGSYWNFYGSNTFGITLIPMLIGVAVLFWNGRSVLGWLLTAAGALFILAGDCQHAYLLSAGDAVPYDRDVGAGGGRAGNDRTRDTVGRRSNEPPNSPHPLHLIRNFATDSAEMANYIGDPLMLPNPELPDAPGNFDASYGGGRRNQGVEARYSSRNATMAVVAGPRQPLFQVALGTSKHRRLRVKRVGEH